VKKPLTNAPYVEPPTNPELTLNPPTHPDLQLPVEPAHRKRPPTPHKRGRTARDGTRRHRRKVSPGQLVARSAVVAALLLVTLTPAYLWLTATPPPAPVVPAVAPIGPVTAPLTDEPTSITRLPRTATATASRATKRYVVPTTTTALTRRAIPRTTQQGEE